jgi:hypothetical protein
MKAILIALTVVALAGPSVAFAQGVVSPETGAGTYDNTGGQRDSYTGNSGIVICQENCGWDDLIILVNRIVNWLVAFLSVIAVIVMVVAGFKMVTSGGNTSAWESAKSMFTNVVIGFILVLAAWLIVDTVLSLLTSCGGINQWLNPGACVQKISGTSGGTAAGTNNNGSVIVGDQYTDADARARLADAGITVNKTKAEGTSLQGINQSTIDEVVALKQSCSCEVVVTAGTEGGHADGTYSHGTGYKVDLRTSADLTGYITSFYTYKGLRSDGAAQYQRNGSSVIYALEGNHWDVSVK